MEDPPSFSLGITQIIPSNTNRVYDNEDLGWAENRSKKLHDPLVMAIGLWIDEIPIQSNAFRSDYHRTRYATLLWKCGSQKIESRYVSHDNDDPSKPKRYFTPSDHDALVNPEYLLCINGYTTFFS
ncbi:hypothetical protein H5410_009048 [Solanum commersonii]|uniref:Uncharacterized protein n=1 Tax=Solanum commersonii TaxID=4109 RepID=A0A9J6AGQ9_SOLCO|nr:hypothetical protein H5410_009048 [Solanum commersonii]